MTLTGYDLSSHNTTAQLADALTKDFVIVKASEGVTYKNPVHDDWIAQTRDKGLLPAHYHFARPENNGPEAEAEWFLTCANAKPGDNVILDFEPPSILPVYPAWAVAFNDIVRAELNTEDWFYTNQSQGKAMVSLASPELRTALFNMPLWKAYYQSTIGDLMGWPTWACWQKTSTPIDTNEFNGDAAKWRALGVPEANMALTDADVQLLLKAIRADAGKTTQNADGSWPLGAVIESRIASVVTGIVRSEGISGAGDVSRFPVAPTAAEVAKAVADEQWRRQES